MARLGFIGGFVCVLALAGAVPPARAGQAEAARAREILDAAGIKGGLVVHIGCGADSTGSRQAGGLTAALRANESYLVHGLDTDAANVAAARENIRSLGLYGPVCVAQFDGRRLPYIDNTVNLVVAESLGQVAMDEVLRVLCPTGVAYVKADGKWARTVKPRPADIDEWTHYMHDAGGNAVAHDTVIGPPRRLQWQAGPQWGRHHDHMSSVTSCVTSGGRVFYIIDEGSRASIFLPPDWKLIARDAFNGTLLWKRPIPQWYPHMMGLKSGPAELPRRLVAVGDRVYVTLGIDAPLTVLDAATGQTIRTYENTGKTQEILFDNGVLFVVSDIPGEPEPAVSADDAALAKRRGITKVIWDLKRRRIQAIQAETGKVLWRHDAPLMPLTPAADATGLYFCDGEKVICLDRSDGQVRWRSEAVPRTEKFRSFFAATLVVYDGVVLFAGGENAGLQGIQWDIRAKDTMTALSARTGEKLWDAYHPASGYRSPEDVLVINGVAWTGATFTGGLDGEFTGRDVKTGKIVRQFKPDVETYWFHHRCYRGKATDKYLLMSRTGTEFIDPTTGHWDINHWTRGACLYGVMPANGLVYNPQHPCACFAEAKENGFTALAPAAKAAPASPPGSQGPRLEKGPAFGAGSEKQAAGADGGWPTYRADDARSGATATPVPAQLKQAWSAELGGRLSAVVVAEGRLLVATIDDHTIHAMDAAEGKELWHYTAGGRVDSPPTIHAGLAIFGCADGYVYCLRAADGKLAWRFRAAPEDRRLVAFDQVESVWPVSGSVLVREGVVHCVAGRSMFLDGGLRMIQLDAATGRLLAEKVLDAHVAETDKDLQAYTQKLNLPVALPDVLSCDANHVYMRSQRFDLAGNREDVASRAPWEQFGPGAHLFSPTGFLDGDYWHRSYWVFGRTFPAGWDCYYLAGKYATSGKILAFDGQSVYGFGRKAQYYRWTTPMEFELFAEIRGVARPGDEETDRAAARAKAAKAGEAAKDGKDGKAAKATAPVSKTSAPTDRRGNPAPGAMEGRRWARDLPILVRAMVLADKTLFVAGLPDLVDEERALANRDDPEIQAALAQQNAAWQGKRGASLMAVAAADGKELAEYKLESPPVWDGLSAANGRLYLATQDGKVICLAP
jgi:outer membrane protein assembly factor BamB